MHEKLHLLLKLKHFIKHTFVYYNEDTPFFYTTSQNDENIETLFREKIREIQSSLLNTDDVISYDITINENRHEGDPLMVASIYRKPLFLPGISYERFITTISLFALEEIKLKF